MVIRSTHFANCDGCGVSFVQKLGNGGSLAAFSDRDTLLLALGAAGWGLLSGDSSDPASWSVLCTYCRGGAS